MPAAASPRRGNPRRGSGIESTSAIDQTTRSARVTGGAARNTIAIMRDAAMHPSSGGPAPTASRDPSPRLGRRAAAGQSDSPAQAARSGMRSRAPVVAPRDATRSRAGTVTRSRRHRHAPRVDDDHDVAGAFSLVLVREEPVEAGGRFPVNPPDLVAGHVLPHAPEIRARADLAGRDLTEPRTGAPRAEPRAPEVFHRGGD